MELNICYERTVRNPSANAIRKELAALRLEEFAILQKSEMDFIQTLRDPERGWVVEYQVNSPDEHFEAANPPHQLTDVIEAFVAYAAGGDEWKQRFHWQHMELTQAELLVVSAVPADALELDIDPLQAEQFVELPEIGLPIFAELCAILTNSTAEAIMAELIVVKVIEPVGMDPAQLIPLPNELAMALASLRTSSAAKVADRWRAASKFPDDAQSVNCTRDMVKELSQLAKFAMAEDGILMLSLLDGLNSPTDHAG